MKHQYFGDVNDYRKYGLLRCLGEATDMKIGVCWMLTSPDARQDGNKVAYLERPDVWRSHDPELFDFLHKHVHIRKQRNITLVRKHNVIPGAMYFEKILTDDPAQRSTYFHHMHNSLSPANLVFFDPDNGLSVKSVKSGGTHSAKYLYGAEIRDVWNRGQSVMVYQHFPRAPRLEYTVRRAGELANVCKGGKVIAFSTAHVLFLLATRNHIPSVVRLVEKRWTGQIHSAPSR